MEVINKEFLSALDGPSVVKLELGGGENPRKGYFSIDKILLPQTDILADLNFPLDCIPDSSIDHIHSRHTFEHISNLEQLMDECFRILKKDAVLEITVPHFSNTYAYSDPTHVRFFGLYSMHYFSECNEKHSRNIPNYSDKKFYIKEIIIEFYRRSRFERLVEKFLKYLVNRSFKTQDYYERRFSYIYPAWQIRFYLIPKK
jgi:predicted SAM-dependent methyltransferase